MENKKYLSILEEIRKSGGKIENDNPNEKILIVDGLNTYLRVFSVVPTQNDDGIHVGGIVGFLKSIASVVKTLSPTRCIVVFDGKGGSTRRRKIYPDYKNKRKTKIRLNRVNEYESLDDERHSMLMQLSRCVEYLETLPITVLSVDNVEADDVIAYSTKQLLTDSKIVIMSTDKDFLQLVNDRISVWSPTKKKLYKPDVVKEEYNVNSNNLLMCRIFDGDASDNIKGVMGIGSKTLLKNIPELKDDVVYSVNDVIKQSDKNNRFGKIVREQKDIMYRNYELMQLYDVDISGSTKLKINNVVNGKIQKLVKPVFQKMFIEDRMFSTLPDLDSWLRLSWTKLNRMAKINNNGT